MVLGGGALTLGSLRLLFGVQTLSLGSRRPLLRLELRLLGAPAPGGRFVSMRRHGGAPFLVPLGSASPRGDGQGDRRHNDDNDDEHDDEAVRYEKWHRVFTRPMEARYLRRFVRIRTSHRLTTNDLAGLIPECERT